MSDKRLNIGFFTCHLDNDYAYEVCQGVDYAAKELDVNLIVFPGMFMNASYNDPVNARFDYQYNSIFYYASKYSLDALIVSIGSIGSFLSQSDMITFLKNFDIPILTIEIEVPGYPYLYTEGKTGMRQVVEHLIKKHGVTKIGMVSGRRENADANERLNTYLEVLMENDIKIDSNKIVYGNFSEFTEELVGTLLDTNPDLEAIVFANDQMAIGGYSAIKKRGLTIGKDILVTGYDNSLASIVLDPPLTTVHNGTMEMGYQSVYEVLKLVKTGKTSKSILPSSLVTRLSCGCSYDNLYTLPKNCKLSSDYLDIILSSIRDTIFYDYSDCFFTNDLYNLIHPLYSTILNGVLSDTTCYNTSQILNLVKDILTDDVMLYFNTDTFTYTLSIFYQILSHLIKSPTKKLETSLLFSEIFSAISLFSCGLLYKLTHEYKSTIWSSMYITRDTLTYSVNRDECFKLIMNKLYNTGYTSSFIYLYDEPISQNPNGSWNTPKELVLQACQVDGNITYFNQNENYLSSHLVFNNSYTPNDRRQTMVITPIFTNETQHGLFICEVDIRDFKTIYSSSLQLGTSMKFMSLMEEQRNIQHKLELSMTEVNDKNDLLNHLSITDELTGLNNRRGFLERVQKAVNEPINNGKSAMILFADMDNLKQVNDMFSHKDGDYAIKNIAKVLVKSFRPNDIIGRIGGDEFVAFAIVDNPNLAEKIEAKITESTILLNKTCGKPYYIDISIGKALFNCDSNCNIETILHAADLILYANKKNKRLSVLKK